MGYTKEETMPASKLIELLKANSAATTEALVRKIKASGRCRDLAIRVPANEQKQNALEIMSDLAEWLNNEDDAVLEQRYTTLGARRAVGTVPLCQVFWSVSIARDCLWEYARQECLHQKTMELLDGVTLLRSLDRFFDRVSYFTIVGYEKSVEDERAALSYLSRRQSA